MFPGDKVPKRRRRVRQQTGADVLTAAVHQPDPDAAEVLSIAADTIIQETTMPSRQQIIEQLKALQADNTVPNLRAELDDVQEAIRNHELRVAERRRDELERDIAIALSRRQRQLDNLLRQLQDEEPQALHDVRRTVAAAFQRHQMSDIPQFMPRQPHLPKDEQPDNSEFFAWQARGESLCTLARELRDLWRSADWADRLQQLIDEHSANVAELRNVRITADV
jgi:hypothetical protein